MAKLILFGVPKNSLAAMHDLSPLNLLKWIGYPSRMGNAIKPFDRPREPVWSRRPEETEREYKFFLLFLASGITRNLKKIVAKFCDESGDDPNEVYYEWSLLSRKYGWEGRADAFDTYHLQRSLRATVHRFVKALSKTTRRMLKTLIKKGEEVEPKSFLDVIRGMQTIASLIPPEGYALAGGRQL